jgi:NitT/TauT family transport system ATP-binding protein
MRLGGVGVWWGCLGPVPVTLHRAPPSLVEPSQGRFEAASRLVVARHPHQTPTRPSRTARRQAPPADEAPHQSMKLEVSGVGKDYLIPVIESVSFTAEAGEFVCLLGPNGCGKTTLLRIIGGIEPASRGHVTIADRPVVFEQRHDRKVGVVFQEDRLLPWLSLRDNVGLVLTPLGLGAAERAGIAERYLRLAGLGGFEAYYPGRVSGGMRQRAAIARALAIEPDLLLMDEPFGALDAQNRRIMQNEVRRIWRETGRTIVFVTHSIEEAVAIGTTLVMLSARPARVRETIRNDGRVERAKLVDDLNTMIMEEVERQQGAGPLGG